MQFVHTEAYLCTAATACCEHDGAEGNHEPSARRCAGGASATAAASAAGTAVVTVGIVIHRAAFATATVAIFARADHDGFFADRIAGCGRANQFHGRAGVARCGARGWAIAVADFASVQGAVVANRRYRAGRVRDGYVGEATVATTCGRRRGAVFVKGKRALIVLSSSNRITIGEFHADGVHAIGHHRASFVFQVPRHREWGCVRRARCAANRIGVGRTGFCPPADEVTNPSVAPALNRFLKFAVSTFNPNGDHILRRITRALLRRRNGNFEAIRRRIGCTDERRNTREQRNDQEIFQVARVHGRKLSNLHATNKGITRDRLLRIVAVRRPCARPQAGRSGFISLCGFVHCAINCLVPTAVSSYLHSTVAGPAPLLMHLDPLLHFAASHAAASVLKHLRPKT